MSRKKPKQEPDKPIRLDLGCGPNPREGFLGVDSIAFNDRVMKHDLTKPWPWKDGSVTEIHSSHFVEHLTAEQRIHFWNELYRVLKPNKKDNGVNVEGFATIVVPHWGSCRAYGDPSHAWPPMSEFAFYYLCRDWRAGNAPHTDAKHWPKGYNCHLECQWGYTANPAIATRNQEYQMHAFSFFKEAIHDIVATICRKD